MEQTERGQRTRKERSTQLYCQQGMGLRLGSYTEYSRLHLSNMTPSVGNSKIVSRQIMQGSSQEAINKAEESWRLQINSKKYI